MQYHVHFGPAPSCAVSDFDGGDGVSSTASLPSLVASPSTSSVQANPSPAHHQESGSGSGVAITVGQGLLSGRRIAVRVAPPLTSSATPVAHVAASASGGIRVGASYGYSGSSLSSGAHSSMCASSSHHAAPEIPASMTSTTTKRVNTSLTYGKGIVRISELRRQGVPSVESGLRLATLPGGRSVAAATSIHGSDAAHGGASEDGDVCYGALTPHAAPSQRRTRQRGSPTRAATTSASASSSSRARGGRSGASTDGIAQRRGRGSSGGSRASTAVALRSDGQLCDYRWFTARGRRCFVYDGRTYKGSSAHRMWEKVKGAVRQRGLLLSQQAAAVSRTSDAPRAGGRADASVAHPTAEARITVPRVHQASARARSATEHVLLPQQTKRRSTAVSPGLVDDATRTGVLVLSQLPVEWRTLMEELGMMPEDDGGAMASDRKGCVLKAAVGTQPPVGAGSVRPPCAPQRRDHLSASIAATEDVIEISDSNSTRDDTDDSDSDTSSSFSSTASPTEVNDDADRGQRNANTVAAGAPLQWPATSYFSDASSEWSSTSSFTTSPARPPPSMSSNSPKRKRGRQERSTNHAVITTTTGASPRLRRYHGVQVVEQDGWVYPVDVYASQQQQQERESEQVRETAPGAASRGATLPAVNGNCTGASGGGAPAPCGVDDMPLADLYREAVTRQSNVVRAPQLSAPALLHAPLSSSKASAGLSVVRGSGAAVPVRPAAVSSAAQGSLLNSCVAIQHNVGRGCVSAFLGVDDNLDDFNTADLADMFVTGEEIGGFRYDG
ncbi:conserved hypothetical protein [Leishmania mexicana MHOM/GT/2001/U1103]|uniref:Uncharacterized protein n=1 Tax=Leishmania mexicana (strain MHOM/GT/2001/U1103) TaxID=929439 RepID=E9AZU0_LEIMU|nr:conserved hypothetical protein [Leishmania mexicana MHOM/GT/2001/U1103]CBZ28491.1 conserved hypothetical protein [Leishmania mexicana MHOM/GT/2001/U1103]